MFRVYLAGLMLWLTAMGAHASTDEASLVQSMRISSFGFSGSLLNNYNHIRTPFQQRSDEGYRQHLHELNRLYRQSGLTVGAEDIKALNDLTDELESMPQLDSVVSTIVLAYPTLITSIYQAQQRFESSLFRYQEMIDSRGAGVITTIDDLRLDIYKIMSLYSVSTFTGLAYLNDMDPDLAILDGKIQEHFLTLEGQAPELSNDIEKIKNIYLFVQPKLVGLSRPWTPSAVVLFLTRAEQALKELANRIDSVQPIG